MRSAFARLLALLFVLFAAACEPAQARAPSAQTRLYRETRWFLGIGQPSCVERLDDAQAGRTGPRDPSAFQQILGEPLLPENPRTMLVRVPILKALLAYGKAADKAEKERYADELRAHFKSNDRSDGIPASAAKAFREMLLDPSGKDRDDIVFVFRSLKGDPLAAELLRILEDKYSPPATAPTPASAAPASSGTPSGQPATGAAASSPATALTTEEAFNGMDKEIKNAIAAVRAGKEQLSEEGQSNCNDWFNVRADFLQKRLTQAEKKKTDAFEASGEAEKAAGLKAASVAYISLFYLAQMSQFFATSFVVGDWNAQQGMAPAHVGTPQANFAADPDIQALSYAVMLGNDPVKLGDALVKGGPRLSYHVGQLQDWIKLSSDSAALAKKVVLVADLLLLAPSLSSLKLPAVAGRGAAGTLGIGGVSGGAAVMSTVQIGRISAALEALQKLIAIGAIQAAPAVAVIAGGHTALSVQNSGNGGGPGAPAASSPGGPAQAGTAASGTIPKEGSFSNVDWTDYPSGVPKPTGPFRLLQDAEYEAARKAADQANAALRRTNPAKYSGKEIHEIHPVKFGGSPTDPANKIALTPADHKVLTRFWAQLKYYIKANSK